jgi:hypothetical protein
MIDLNPFKDPNAQYGYKDRHTDKKSITGFLVWSTMIFITTMMYVAILATV